MYKKLKFIKLNEENEDNIQKSLELEIKNKFNSNVRFLGKGAEGMAWEIVGKNLAIKVGYTKNPHFPEVDSYIKDNPHELFAKVYEVGKLKNGESYSIKELCYKIDDETKQKIEKFFIENIGIPGSNDDLLSVLFHEFYVKGKDNIEKLKNELPEIYNIFKIGSKYVWELGMDNFDAGFGNIMQDKNGNLKIVDI